MAEIVAVIPARGGSKGIPRKNLAMLAGQPLLSYMVCAAKHSRHINRVLVSTDDAEIAEVGRTYGAETVLRPPEISGDTASSESALLHVLDHLQQTEQYTPDILVFLQCTAPLTTTEDIDGTIAKLIVENADSAFTACPFWHFLWTVDSDGKAVGINHDSRLRARRQDRDPQFLETGAVYVIRVACLRENHHRFCGKTVLYTVAVERCLEIDTPHDLRLAEGQIVSRRHVHTSTRVRDRAKHVRIFAVDVDGTLTDGGMYYDADGERLKCFNTRDAHGMDLLRKHGVEIAIITGEDSPVVKARGTKLGIRFLYTNADDKSTRLASLVQDLGCAWTELAYVGDDLNDLEVLKKAGLSACPSDAQDEIKEAVDYVCVRPGGHGAVRECCDLILRAISDGQEE